MLDGILREHGLKPEEIRIYTALLERGALKVSELAKLTGLQRTTLYGYLELLKSQGLVRENMDSSAKTFEANSPKAIDDLLAQKIARLSAQKKNFSELLPQLLTIHGKSRIKPKIQIFSGREEMIHALEDVLSFSGIEIRNFWPIENIIDLVGDDYLHYHNKERIRRNIAMKSIWPSGDNKKFKGLPCLGHGPDFLREVRLAPEGSDFTMGYAVYTEKTIIVSSRTEFFSFLVHSREFAHMMLNQHRIIWAVSTPLTDNVMSPDLFHEDEP